MKYLKHFKIHSDYEEYINGKAVLPNVSYTEDSLKVYYNPIPHDYSKDYFTMVVTVGGDVAWAGNNYNTLYYSKDNGKTWSEPSDGITLSVNKGDKVLWKGETTPINGNGIGTFSGGTDVRYTVEGNIMSLLFGHVFKGQTSLGNKSYAFYRLFYGSKNITSAEKLSLPATTLANNCYNSMFEYSTSLVTAPVLPATTLADNCYESMFGGCSSLVTAPELPATTLANYCYQNMFGECSSLVTAPELPATTLANGCYSNMFSSCTSLTTAPELPATTLVENCYANMFDWCTKLNYIKCLATDISATDCTKNWVKEVTSSGTFVKAVDMEDWSIGWSGIPSRWTVVDA